MIPERIGVKIWDLRAEARDELYLLIDKHHKKNATEFGRSGGRSIPVCQTTNLN